MLQSWIAGKKWLEKQNKYLTSQRTNFLEKLRLFFKEGVVLEDEHYDIIKETIDKYGEESSFKPDTSQGLLWDQQRQQASNRNIAR